MTKLALAFLVPFASVAQDFDFTLERSLWFSGSPSSPASFTGTATVDAGTGMVDIAGTFQSEAFIRSGSYGRQIVVPGQLPHEDIYDQFVNYTLSVAGAYVDFTVGPSIPTLINGTLYQMPFDVALATTVTVSYTITENEVEVGSGSGTYTAYGTPSSVVLDRARYPGQLGVRIDSLWLDPRDSTLQPIQFPHGDPMPPPIVGLYLAAVPEPAEWGVIAGIGLVAMAVCRRARRLS